jgi:RNA polymerase-binding transcription factor DksA
MKRSKKLKTGKKRAVRAKRKAVAAKPRKITKAAVSMRAGPAAKAASRIAVPAPVVEVREPKKLKLSPTVVAKYRGLLLELRDHLIDRVSFLASDNLKRSHRDASGELSGYSLHMADAGTDNFDREFALSLVSSEQEALYEIEEALKRLEHGTYGLCEMCERPIRKERLEAVPFARLCVQCQSGVEKDRRHVAQPAAAFSEQAEEEGAEAEESEE